MKAREIFNECQGDVPLSVANVHGSAGDNAAETLGSRFERGNFTDEFINIWFNTVSSILCDGECEQEARDWFESRGVTY